MKYIFYGALFLILALGVVLTILESIIDSWPYSLYFILTVVAVGGILALAVEKTGEQKD